MRRPFITIFFALFLAGPVFGKKPNTFLILHLKNADSTYFALGTSEKGLLFEDAQADLVDTFYLDLQEPIPFLFIIQNDTSKRFTGYLDIGKNEIVLDLQDPQHPVFINSPINEDYFYWKYKRDSIWDQTFSPEARELISLHGQASVEYDSIYHLLYIRNKALTRQEYEIRSKQTSHYLTLMFVRSELEMILKDPKRSACTRAELRSLFDQLEDRLKKYPVYAACLQLFDLDIGKPPSIAPPLFSPQ